MDEKMMVKVIKLMEGDSGRSERLEVRFPQVAAPPPETDVLVPREQTKDDEQVQQRDLQSESIAR